jgi:ATP/maltotriose-dependent transcriptional regulator MalT
MPPSASSTRLVGREQELARLDDALRDCGDGISTVFVVGGEAGVGKTRLARAFLEDAATRGATTLSGRCFELVEASLPYAPFVEALRRLVQELDPEVRDAVFGSGRRELVHLLPELGPPGERAPERVSVSAQGRLFELLLGLIRRLGERVRVAAVIEDLHWADRSTLELLGFLIGNLSRERIVVVCTYRSDELHRGHPLRGFLAELDRGRSIERIELERFTRAELIEQLEELLGRFPESSLVDSIFARSEGNAFFAEELVAATREGATHELPPTLREILLARVDRLSPAAQTVLRVASVAGRQVPEDLLATVSPLSPEERVAGLREAVAHQVLILDGDDAYAFRHALAREAVYEQLLPSERTELHDAYARALESRPERPVGEIAYHWAAAHNLGRALVSAVVAGDAAQRSYGFAEAQRFYEQALELWPRVPEADRADLDEVALIRRAAEAANLAGDHGRAAAFASTAIRATSTQDPVFAGLLHERLGRFLWASGDSEAALRAYEEAVRLVPAVPPSPARARALAAQGQALMLMARYGESKESCDDAIAIARAVGARAEEGHALNTLGFDLACLGDPETGVERLREALAIAEEVGDLDDLARAYLNRSELLAGPLNRLEEALALAIEGVALSRRVGLASDYGVSLQANAALALYGLGRWEEALSILAEAEQARPIEMAAIDLHQALARLYVSRGEFQSATAQLDAVRRMMVNTVDPQYNVPLCAREAELALWQRNHAEARRAIAKGLLHLAGTDDIWFMGPLIWLGAWADVDAALELRVRRAAAEEPQPGRFLDEIRAVLSRRERAGSYVPPGTLAYAGLCEAELSRLAPDPDPGRWRTAAAAWERLGHPYPFAYARWREAEALLVGRQARAAERPLREAYDVATRLGARPLLAELGALAGRAKVALESAPPAQEKPSLATELGLTRRERQVLALLAEGLTNREIATILFVTEKTAAAHVSNILGKLGVRSRVEAATAVHRLGLLPEPLSNN